jgi:hypothetical protein
MRTKAFCCLLAVLFLAGPARAGLSSTPAWTGEGDQAEGRYATAVASAGDVNGDGFDDVIVGMPLWDFVQLDEGRALVYHGSVTGLSSGIAWAAEIDQDVAHFGAAVASAGDVNGDGYDDVVVGAPYYDNFQVDDGRAFVFLGSASGLGTSPSSSVRGGVAGARLGSSVAGAGDVNGDGYDDVIIGVPRYTNGQAHEGRAVLYLGSVNGMSTTVAWSAEGNQAEALLGTSVAGAGDVNGDGYDDVVVGAPEFDSGLINTGRALVYLGSSTGLATTPAWVEDIDEESALLGASVGGAGDVNGDGYDDVIVGAPFAGGESFLGAAYVYLGTASGLSTAPIWTGYGPESGDRYGQSVGPAGDVQGDGYDDVIVGSPLFVNHHQQGQEFGAAEVHLGSAAGVETFPSWGILIDQSFSDYGWDNVQTNEGRAFVYLGEGTPWPTGGEVVLNMGKLLGSGFLLIGWGPSCAPADTDYAVYEGTLWNFTSHSAMTCTTSDRTYLFSPTPGDRYYLVVPRTATAEGSYGRNSAGIERPPAASACVMQEVGGCP